MGRPKKAIPSVEKNICIPLDLVTRVDLELFSEIEGRVPFGAWQRYITNLIRKDLQEKGQCHAADNLPL